ncbi:MAG: hypothetical protein E6Q73_10645 [Pseudorhodobacter sp.]|nr:MAG: hypothetical protein E6Q73_10645 [Pseudorhodobacter sp.]
MEFVLLPLLLLVGLATALDGGNDDGDGGGDGDSLNDVLTGSGTDRLFGGTGDDDLTLEDRAVGLGGVGDDTIHARDEAVGYGLEGDDSLTGEDNATIKGGAGDDWLSAEDEAAADGGSGDDWLTLAGDANGSGGDGDDTLTASGEAVIRGGAGNDVLIYQDTAGVDAPEEGDDIYVLDHAAPGGANLGFAYQSRDAGDRIAIHLGTDDLSNFSFRTVSGSNDGYDDSRGDITEIFITETLADGETKDSYLSIRGVYGYGLRNLILYGEEIGQEVDWQEYFGENDFIEASGSETVHGGVGNDHIDLDDSAVGYGDAGDDLIHTWGTSTAYGGAGDDRMSETAGTTTLHGGVGNDTLGVDNGAAYGGDGTDTINLTYGGGQGYGGAGNDALSGSYSDGMLYGGVGDDSLEVDGGSAYGGAGNDVLSGIYFDGTLHGDDGNDRLEVDGGSAHGDTGDDTLSAEGRASLFGGDGDDVISGKATLEGGAGNDRLELGFDRDVSADRPENLFYGQADGGDGNDTILAVSGVQLDDNYTTSGSMAIRGGAGDDYIAASDIYAIDAGTGDDTVSILSDDTSGQQDVTLGAGNDVVLADVAGVSSGNFYGIGAVVTDFNPAEDQLAIILEQGATAPLVTYAWDAVRGGTDVISDDGVRFFLEGVNHQVTPLSVSFYASEAALQAGTPYATA